jgi:histidine triad (HIT) family protein
MADDDTADCPFCAYARGDVELPEGGHLSDGVMAFPPLDPFAPGHTLFVPMAHTADITTAPDRLVADVMARASGYARLLLADHDGVNVLTSVGEAATQTVMHWHVHVIPRRDGDQLGGWPWRDRPRRGGVINVNVNPPCPPPVVIPVPVEPRHRWRA